MQELQTIGSVVGGTRQWLNVVIGQHVNQRRYSDCTRRYSLAYQMISSRVLHAVRRRGINIILIALDTHAVYGVNTYTDRIQQCGIINRAT